MRKTLITLLILVLSPLVYAQITPKPIEVITVQAGDQAGLRNAISLANVDSLAHYKINIVNSVKGFVFLISEPLPTVIAEQLVIAGSGAEKFSFQPTSQHQGPFLTVISGRLEIHGVEINGFNNVANGGGIVVAEGGRLFAKDIFFTDLSSNGHGGVVDCGPGSECEFNHVLFRNNHANGNGGALYCNPGSTCSVEDSTFLASSAGLNGGAYSCQNNAMCFFNNSIFKNGSAAIIGCDGDSQGAQIRLEGVAASEDGPWCFPVRNQIPTGNWQYINSYTQTDLDTEAVDCSTSCVFQGAIVGANTSATTQTVTRVAQKSSSGNSLDSQCNDFGTGAFTSLGFNIDRDDSCALDQPSDLAGTDPLLVVDANGIPQPQPESPVIESGRVNFVNNNLPCRYKDLNGLGRPQDFDLDGVFTCDRGPVEVQGGLDIGAAQTAAFFSLNRNGEGTFVEMLAGGLAIISFYTYSLDGTQLAWYMGLGQVVGNSIVVDELQKVTGGLFGVDFNEDNIVRTNVGGMSLIFPDCAATINPGRLNFTARSDSGLENLLQSASRLTSIVNCDGTKAANAGRSGAFFALGRSGEGIFVQWLADGRVVLVFYTFDPDGNPFWTTSDTDNTAVNGNSVTAQMLYAGSKTKFGVNFNSSEITLLPWGTITLTYTDDDHLTFAYQSFLAGFDAGSHAYVRLTQPLGTKAVAQKD